VARPDDQPHDQIVLDDGTWVDVGPDGRWHPSPGERARAAVILGVGTAALLLLALVVSVGGGGRDREAASTDTTTTEAVEATDAADPGVDPSSIDGEPASPDCVADDRDAQPLRNRRQAIVLVLNATSQGGHAGAVSTLLEARGYETATPGNAGGREVTSVAYLAGFCAEAERLVEDLGLTSATVEPVPADLLATVGRARLVLSLGADSLGE
jgi:hypothetical protein